VERSGPHDPALGTPGFRTGRTLSVIGFFDFTCGLGHKILLMVRAEFPEKQPWIIVGVFVLQRGQITNNE